MPEIIETRPRSKPLAFGSGVLIGTLGGLIGLGGAEFRMSALPQKNRVAAGVVGAIDEHAADALRAELAERDFLRTLAHVMGHTRPLRGLQLLTAAVQGQPRTALNGAVDDGLIDGAVDNAGVRFAPKATLNSITSSAPAKRQHRGLGPDMKEAAN
jgi:hypothetical protein